MIKKTDKKPLMIGILKIISETGMTKKEILKHIGKGNIKHGYNYKNLMFEAEELEQLIKKRKSHIGLWKLVNNLLNDNTIFSTKKPTHKNDLLDYLELNNWFEVNIIPSKDVYFTATKGEEYFVKKADAGELVKHISLWLNAYGCSDKEKMYQLLKWVKEQHAKTGKLISKFIIQENPNKKAMWILLDYLSFSLEGELVDINEEDLEQLSIEISKKLPLNSAKIFSNFLLYLKSNRYMSNGWNYHYGTRSQLKNNTAYSLTAFSKMAYIIFNEAMWGKHNLLSKALASKKCANLWLFVSLHFICAWRSTDMVRLPKPRLPQEGRLIREKIQSNLYNTDDTIFEIELMLNNMSFKPSKTKTNKSVPDLKIFFPETLRKPLGIMLTVASSWCDDIQTGMPFIQRAGSIPEIKQFFGMDFFNLCDEKRFSTRRANKSYLQGIEKASDSSGSNAKGYMIAALARSHKGGINKLPATTDIYLKDANFTGYTPEFIAKEMFERGVFSFIPSILLEIYSSKAYSQLHVSAQTEIISNIGISSTSIENISGLASKSIDVAKNAVMKIINQPEEIRANISDLLQNIATGNANSKQDNCMCLLIAANLACSNPERGCCIGCGYEIYTKSLIEFLVREYKRLTHIKRHASKSEAIRRSKILRIAIMPALTEIIASIKGICPDYDAVKILKGVLDDVTGKNKLND
jgi:hypothetical protein